MLSTAARPRSCTATPRSRSPTGSTTRSTSTPGACSAAGSRRCAGQSANWSPFRPAAPTTNPPSRSFRPRTPLRRRRGPPAVPARRRRRRRQADHPDRPRAQCDGARGRTRQPRVEVMSRFAIDPRWLVYLPPTMAPTGTSNRPDVLEYPEQAFSEYRADGVPHVICEEKHMGSRAIVIVCRDSAVFEDPFRHRQRRGWGDLQPHRSSLPVQRERLHRGSPPDPSRVRFDRTLGRPWRPTGFCSTAS